MHKAAFLDRDGTIISNEKFINDPNGMLDLPFVPGAIEGMKLLHERGYRLIIVTNQAGVARGHLTERSLVLAHDILSQRLSKLGAPLWSIKYCIHDPDAHCECRKPKPGMLLYMQKKHRLTMSDSVIFGDQPTDLAAGIAAGVSRGFLVEREWPAIDRLKVLV